MHIEIATILTVEQSGRGFLSARSFPRAHLHARCAEQGRALGDIAR